jgi:hypothetical protein
LRRWPRVRRSLNSGFEEPSLLGSRLRRKRTIDQAALMLRVAFDFSFDGEYVIAREGNEVVAWFD